MNDERNKFDNIKNQHIEYRVKSSLMDNKDLSSDVLELKLKYDDSQIFCSKCRLYHEYDIFFITEYVYDQNDLKNQSIICEQCYYSHYSLYNEIIKTIYPKDIIKMEEEIEMFELILKSKPRLTKSAQKGRPPREEVAIKLV